MSKLPDIQPEESNPVKLDPDTIMHRPPTKQQQKSAEAHKRGFAKWEDSRKSEKKTETAGDAVREWYFQRQKEMKNANHR